MHLLSPCDLPCHCLGQDAGVGARQTSDNHCNAFPVLLWGRHFHCMLGAMCHQDRLSRQRSMTSRRMKENAFQSVSFSSIPFPATNGHTPPASVMVSDRWDSVSERYPETILQLDWSQGTIKPDPLDSGHSIRRNCLRRDIGGADASGRCAACWDGAMLPPTRCLPL